MFDYYGVYIGVSTKSSYLFYIDFCLAITKLGKQRKQNARKIISQFFFFIERMTYSGDFKNRLILALLNRHYSLYLKKKPYSSGLKKARIGAEKPLDLS